MVFCPRSASKCPAVRRHSSGGVRFRCRAPCRKVSCNIQFSPGCSFSPALRHRLPLATRSKTKAISGCLSIRLCSQMTASSLDFSRLKWIRSSAWPPARESLGRLMVCQRGKVRAEHRFCHGLHDGRLGDRDVRPGCPSRARPDPAARPRQGPTRDAPRRLHVLIVHIPCCLDGSR